jgi:hypothetical protein
MAKSIFFTFPKPLNPHKGKIAARFKQIGINAPIQLKQGIGWNLPSDLDCSAIIKAIKVIEPRLAICRVEIDKRLGHKNRVLNLDAPCFALPSTALKGNKPARKRARQLQRELESAQADKDHRASETRNNEAVKHRLLLDSKRFTSKPTNAKALSGSLTDSPASVTIEELAEALSHGQSFTPGFFDKDDGKGRGRRKTNFTGASIVALDFDNSLGKDAEKNDIPVPKDDRRYMTVDRVLGILRDHDLEASFGYYTFSHSERSDKFRLVFALPLCITDRNAYEVIVKALMLLFDGSLDRGCKDCSRLFYGGIGLCYKNYDYTLDLDKVFAAAHFKIGANACGKKNNMKRVLNQGKDIKKWASLLNTSLGHFVEPFIVDALRCDSKIEAETGTAYNNISTSRRSLKNAITENDTLDEAFPIIEKVDWSKLRSRVKLFDDFLNGKKLYHPQLLAIATSLHRLKGGATLFIDTLNKFSSIYNVEEKELIMVYCRSQGYFPGNLDSSPHVLDQNYPSLYAAARPPAIEALPTQQKHFLSIEEGRKLLNESLSNALSSDSDTITIIRCPTGLGKTHSFIQQTQLNKPHSDISLFEALFCTPFHNAVVAFPNHALKSQVKERYQKTRFGYRDPILFTPDYKEYITDPHILEQISHYQQIGDYVKAKDILRERAKTDERIAEYLKLESACYAAKNTVLTTHAKSLFIDWENHGTIIYDEDPLQTLLPTGEVSLDDLNRVSKISTNDRDRQSIEELIKTLSTATEQPLINSLALYDSEGLRKAIIEGNYKWEGQILDAIFCRYFVKNSSNTLSFINTRELPNKRIIILSATTNPDLYRAMYPGRKVEFVDIPVGSLAEIVQVVDWSMSQSSLKNNIDKALELVGDGCIPLRHK